MHAKKLPPSVAGLLCLATLLVTSGVEASWTNMHGSTCQADTWSRAFSDQYVYGVAGVENAYAATPGQLLYVTCPIQKEVRDDDNPMAYVSVTDQNPNADFSCTLYNVNDNGTVNWSQTLSSSGSSASYQNIVFLPPILSGEWVLKCAIPPPYNGVRSRLHSYHFRD